MNLKYSKYISIRKIQIYKYQEDLFNVYKVGVRKSVYVGIHAVFPPKTDIENRMARSSHFCDSFIVH